MTEHKEKQTTIPCGVLTVEPGYAHGLNLPDPDSKTWREHWRLYVVAEYEEIQLSSEVLDEYPLKGGATWIAGYRPLRFDILPTLEEKKEEEVTLSLFVSRRELDASTRPSAPEGDSTPPAIFLGRAKLNPFLLGSGRRTVDIQDGTGSINLEISYAQKEISTAVTQGNDWGVRGKNVKKPSHRGHVYVEKVDSGRSYGLETVDAPSSVYSDDSHTGGNLASGLSLRSGIKYPFIAPLKFAFISNEAEGRLELLSPLASGGYLSDHLQRKRQFSVLSARFYAAELVCVLEYLHGKNIVVGSFKMEDILLNSCGHVSFWKPNLYALEPLRDRDCISPGTQPFPAPESPSSDSNRNPELSKAGDWWSLGIILYELLTGFPPFYNKDDAERQHKISHHELQLPEFLPPAAKDILTNLLNKDPTQRLGATDNAEIKDHVFFNGLHWDNCAERTLDPPFKPYDALMVFFREPHTYKHEVIESPKGEVVEIHGTLYELPEPSEFQIPRKIGPAPEGDDPGKPAMREDWELTWDSTEGKLFFHNRSTDQKVLARCSVPKYMQRENQGETAPPRPFDHLTEAQIEAALVAALETGYSRHVFTQLLSYSSNLNVGIPSLPHLFGESGTPLSWAIDDNRLDLVQLFLSHGADADYTLPLQKDPPLVRVVKRKRLHQMVEPLLRRTTNRVTLTRALAQAVEQQDVTLVTKLLTHGVRCNFEDSDCPLPQHPFYWDYDSGLSRTVEAEDFAPPLARAARVGNVTLIKLLLEHGADVIAAYHDLGGWKRVTGNRDCKVAAGFACGRAVQIAMEMGFVEVVRVLVDAGAGVDVDMELPRWEVLGHVCPPVPRAVYLEVVNGINQVVAEREGSRAGYGARASVKSTAPAL
ncbi:hypothetical protein BJX70DRAFT_384754 [Aspergillus crustosus]